MLHVSLGDKMGLNNYYYYFSFFLFLVGFEYSMLWFFSFFKKCACWFQQPAVIFYETNSINLRDNPSNDIVIYYFVPVIINAIGFIISLRRLHCSNGLD